MRRAEDEITLLSHFMVCYNVLNIFGILSRDCQHLKITVVVFKRQTYVRKIQQICLMTRTPTWCVPHFKRLRFSHFPHWMTDKTSLIQRLWRNQGDWVKLAEGSSLSFLLLFLWNWYILLRRFHSVLDASDVAVQRTVQSSHSEKVLELKLSEEFLPKRQAC